MLLSPEQCAHAFDVFEDCASLYADFKVAARKVDPVESFLLVGGTLDGRGNLCEVDAEALADTMFRLKIHGVPCARRPEISIANLNKCWGGEDFLEGKLRANAVLLCMVYNPDAKDVPKSEGRHAISPHHFKPSAWYDATVAAGAKALLVGGGRTSEINSSYFRKQDGLYRMVESNSMTAFLLRRDYAARISPSVRL